jgi:hypothetical protein
MVSLGLGKLELAIAGATSEPDVDAVSEALRRYGDDWLPRFLADRGVAYAPREKERAYA